MSNSETVPYPVSKFTVHAWYEPSSKDDDIKGKFAPIGVKYRAKRQKPMKLPRSIVVEASYYEEPSLPLPEKARKIEEAVGSSWDWCNRELKWYCGTRDEAEEMLKNLYSIEMEINVESWMSPILTGFSVEASYLELEDLSVSESGLKIEEAVGRPCDWSSRDLVWDCYSYRAEAEEVFKKLKLASIPGV